MPRLSYYNGEYNENIDFCRTCAPTQEQASKLFAAKAPDGEVSTNDDHPDYQGEGYECDNCRATLTARDN